MRLKVHDSQSHRNVSQLTPTGPGYHQQQWSGTDSRRPYGLDNTLDLILTNSPSKVLQTDTLPGISDHDIVYSEFDFRHVIHRQTPLSIPLYNKADWDSIRLDMMNLLKDLTDMFNEAECTANTMWNTFRDTLINSTSKNTPLKQRRTNMDTLG